MNYFRRQRFIEMFLSSCCGFHDNTVPVFNAASRESDVDFQPSPLCTEISSIINLLIMLCTIDDEIFKVFMLH